MYNNGANNTYNKSAPTIYMRPEVMQKVMAYYRLIDDVHKGAEISGLGLVQDWEGDLLVHDFMLFKQEVTAGDTELDPAELAAWLSDMLTTGLDPELVRLWWHKHPIQGWSTIDDANIERMNNENWLLSLVHTPQGLLARLDLYKPFRCTLDNLQIMELTEKNTTLDETIKTEIKEKVSRKNYGGTVTQFGLTGSYVHSDNYYQDSKKNGNRPSAVGETNDDYFARLADRDWEKYYSWDEYERELEELGEPTPKTPYKGVI